MSAADASRPGVGPIEEEMARLIDSLLGDTGRPEQGDRAPSGPGAGPGAAGAHGERRATGAGATGADSCRYCPLCRGISTLSAVDPAILDRLAGVADLVADGLRSASTHLAARRAADAPAGPSPGRPGADAGAGPTEPGADAKTGGAAGTGAAGDD